MTIVADSSLVAASLTEIESEGGWAASVIAGERLAGPELVMAESSNIIRRLELSGRIPRHRADAAHESLLRMDIVLFPFVPFAPRVWALRHSVTSYDAWYVALDETLGCPLATLDRRLSRSPGPSCRFITPPDNQPENNP